MRKEEEQSRKKDVRDTTVAKTTIRWIGRKEEESNLKEGRKKKKKSQLDRKCICPLLFVPFATSLPLHHKLSLHHLRPFFFPFFFGLTLPPPPPPPLPSSAPPPPSSPPPAKDEEGAAAAALPFSCCATSSARCASLRTCGIDIQHKRLRVCSAGKFTDSHDDSDKARAGQCMTNHTQLTRRVLSEGIVSAIFSSSCRRVVTSAFQGLPVLGLVSSTCLGSDCVCH